ncbi:MAG: hypothetical protein ACREBV_06155, partial [Candidatus Zixiibacteriota bacterium]
LYTNIGRGHPFYLDGIVEILKNQNKLKFEIHDVFAISKRLSLSAWQLARTLYHFGSTDSLIGNLYNRLRDKTEYHRKSLPMELMGRGIRKKFLDDDTPLVVDHPVLVGLLAGKKNLIYQHGEIAVPKQAVVKGAAFVFVPLESSAASFIDGGYDRNQVFATGLCIEPRLVEQSTTAYESRIKRFGASEPLVGAFFSSGAEPKPHLNRLTIAAMAVSNAGGKAIVFAKRDGKLNKMLFKKLVKSGNGLELLSYEPREELDNLTAERFAVFDYIVSPSHERTNWALGLGLPMFVLEPAIGPFAPMNRSALLEAGVAEGIVSLEEATLFGQRLETLRQSGKLAHMAQAGWKKHPVIGFQMIADFLINKYARNS